MRRHGRRWSEEEEAAVRLRYPLTGSGPLAEEFGRTRPSVSRRAWQLRVSCGRGQFGRTPPVAVYRAMLKAECRDPELFSLVLTKTRKYEPSRIRFRVWAKLYAEGYSLSGIASAADKHHTTILIGLRRIKEIDARAVVISVDRSPPVFTRSIIVPLIRAVGMR